MSRRPYRSTISFTAFSTSVRLVTSTLAAKASMPSFTSWRAVESAPSNFTSVRHTRAPSRAKRRAVASPIPRDAPVTIATLPSRRPNVCRSFQSLSISARSALRASPGTRRPRAGEVFGVQDQSSCPLAEGGEALVCCLAVLVAGVDLLQYPGQLEVPEDDVPVHLGEVAPTLFGVAVDELFAGHGAWRYRHSRHDGRKLVGVARFDPVRERDGEVEEWVPDGRHLPVENRTHTRQVFRVEDEVIELVVVVDDGRRWALGDVTGQPVREGTGLFYLVGLRPFVA